MRRLELAGSAAKPSIVGLLLGGILSACVVLVTASAIAQSEPVPKALLEVSHLPPLLTAPGEKVELGFDVHCTPGGTEDPERACGVTGSLFVRAGSSGRFEETPLQEVRSDGLRRLSAAISPHSVEGRNGFEYYAEIEVTDHGDQIGRASCRESGGLA